MLKQKIDRYYEHDYKNNYVCGHCDKMFKDSEVLKIILCPKCSKKRQIKEIQ